MTRISSREIRAVSAAVSDLTFVPTANMMKAKARFYSNWHGMSTPTQADVMEILDSEQMRVWWSAPGFMEWWTNSDSSRAQMAYLKELALTTAESILRDADANTGAKVNMIKAILAYDEALSARTQEQQTIKINSMSTEDIQKRLKEVVLTEGQDEREST